MKAAWMRLGERTSDRWVRGLLLLTVFLLPVGSVWIISEANATVAGARNSFAVPVFYLIEGLVLVTAAAWSALRLRDARHRRVLRQNASLLAPLLGLVVLAAASILWAPEPLLAGVGAIHLAVAFSLAAMLAYELRDRAFLRAVFWTFTAAAALQAVWGIAQYAAQHDFGLWRLGESGLAPDKAGIAKVATIEGPLVRAYGSLPHPNVLAAYLSLAAFWVGTVVFWKNGERSRLRQLGFALLLALLGAGLLVTFSRVAIIATLVGGVLVALFSWRRWQWLPPAAGIAAAATLAVALVLAPALMQRTSLESRDETGITNRAVGYRQAALVITTQPHGAGIGNFVPVAHLLDAGRPAYQYQPVHNVPLLATAELGLLGGALLAWFAARLGRRFHRSSSRNRRERSIEFMLLSVTGAFVLMAAADHFFWSQVPGLLLGAVLLSALLSRRAHVA
ncbi:MAG: O-antigen ligase family protein [Patescibacteria group bacterium]